MVQERESKVRVWLEDLFGAEAVTVRQLGSVSTIVINLENNTNDLAADGAKAVEAIRTALNAELERSGEGKLANSDIGIRGKQIFIMDKAIAKVDALPDLRLPHNELVELHIERVALPHNNMTAASVEDNRTRFVPSKSALRAGSMPYSDAQAPQQPASGQLTREDKLRLLSDATGVTWKVIPEGAIENRGILATQKTFTPGEIPARQQLIRRHVPVVSEEIDSRQYPGAQGRILLRESEITPEAAEALRNAGEKLKKPFVGMSPG